MINGQKFICLDDKAFELYNRGYSLVNKLDEFNEVYFKEIKAKCSNLNALPLIVIEMIRKHNYDNLVDIYDKLTYVQDILSNLDFSVSKLFDKQVIVDESI